MTKRQRSDSTESLQCEKKIHPEFSKRRSGDYLLVANDGTGFYFPSELLNACSAFFKGISAIPSPIKDSDSTPTIELDAATSSALRATLQIIQISILREGKAPKYGQVCQRDDFDLEEVLTLADTYDLPCIPGFLFHRYNVDLFPWDRFLLALMTKEDDLIKAAYTDIAYAVPPEEDEKAAKKFEKWSQGSLWTLSQFYIARQSDWIALQTRFHNDNGPLNRECDDFCDECNSKEKCGTYRAYCGDWCRMRREVGDELWRSMAFRRAGGDDWREEPAALESLEQILQARVSCYDCARMVEEKFAAIIRDYFKNLPRWGEKRKKRRWEL